MAKKRGKISQLPNYSWLYEINFRREEFTVDVLKHNQKEINQLIQMIVEDPDVKDIKEIQTLVDDLDERFSDFTLQIGTMIEAEENGEDYIINEYDMTTEDVKEEIEYALHGIFDIFDTKIHHNNFIYKFCWAGVN